MTTYSVGQGLSVVSVGLHSKQTKPPSRFTDGSLIDAMTHVDKFVSSDRDKQILREAKGIGTERTRNAIIETLISRGFLRREKKALVSSDIGRTLIAALPTEVSDPVTTARWEMAMGLIEDGKTTLEKFMGYQESFVSTLIQTIRAMPMQVDGPKCPKCADGVLLSKKVTKKGSKAFGKTYLGCSNWPGCDHSAWPSN